MKYDWQFFGLTINKSVLSSSSFCMHLCMFVDIMMENVSLLEADMQIKGMETTFPYSHDTHPLIFVLCCIFSYAGCVALMTVSRPVHYS